MCTKHRERHFEKENQKLINSGECLIFPKVIALFNVKDCPSFISNSGLSN
jgi:hypothetical protein